MAEYLASIFGTEKDKVNCSFYFKIGACRHGDRCSRLHNKPTFSQTIALLNIYRNPQNTAQSADGLRCIGLAQGPVKGVRGPEIVVTEETVEAEVVVIVNDGDLGIWENYGSVFCDSSCVSCKKLK
ncbi:Splicing factor U2AF 35 kDa subunit [Acipenser ruthenus]|uniref:Splicing factor U2AF 35 kDa subunit n=1 Tax=Acipenser ruthenus TaxID=7906 RepID=A0A444V7A7_ACIRT|nr:Splicing factor U2AF 35 kDa subunit [Acipenser ruthenus]